MKWALYGLAAIVIVLFSFLYFKPSATGNVVLGTNVNLTDYKNKLDAAQTTLATTKSDLEQCLKGKSAAIADMKKLNGTSSTSCESASNADTTDWQKKYADAIKQRDSALKRLKEEQDKAKVCEGSGVASLNESLTVLAQNSANNICCKQRVDNNNLNSYKIEDNKIVCSDSAELKISCPQ